MLCSTLQRPSNWTMPDALSPSRSTAAFPRPVHFVPATHRAAFRSSLVRESRKSTAGSELQGLAGAHTDETRPAPQGSHPSPLGEKQKANGEQLKSGMMSAWTM